METGTRRERTRARKARRRRLLTRLCGVSLVILAVGLLLAWGFAPKTPSAATGGAGTAFSPPAPSSTSSSIAFMSAPHSTTTSLETPSTTLPRPSTTAALLSTSSLSTTTTSTSAPPAVPVVRHGHTAEALPQIITRLRSTGYELVTLTQLLGS